MRKHVFFLFILGAVILSFHPSVFAAKVRIRKTNSGGTLSTSFSTAKLSRGTNSVVLTLQNLQSATKVTYELSYTANGMSQGAMGSVVVAGQKTDTRDLYFGTCSHGVCTPHANIKNASLVVKTQLKSGGTNTKIYRIKI